jgi:hypothetical protein
VFDDAPQVRRVSWSADQIADALRAPLALIGVRVVRQHGDRSNSPMAGFQARGSSRSRFKAMLNQVENVVDNVTNSMRQVLTAASTKSV